MNSIYKSVRIVTTLILITFFTQSVFQSSYGQCSIGDSIATYNTASFPIGVRTKINDTISSGEFLALINLQVDLTYTFDVCGDGANTNLTLFDSTKTSIEYSDNGCGNDGRITFIAPATGRYYIQLNLVSCAVDVASHDLYLRVDSSFCTIGTPHSTYNTSIPADDVRTVIYSNVKAGQYVTLNNIVANKTYILDACSDPANTSLTLKNPSGTPIKFSSYGCGNDGRITFTAPVSGAYRLYLNIDMCGTDAVNHTLYITKLSCANPASPNISVTTGVTCYGETAVLSFSGALNDAAYWLVFKDSVGSEILDTAFTTPYSFVPLKDTRTYFVRGQGGCVYSNDALWDSVSFTTNYKDAGFTYNSSSYCVQDVDTIPSVTGEAGGTFSATPSGLSISSTTGRIDNSASTPGAYVISYTTLGPCPATSTYEVSITSLDDVTFTYGDTIFCKSNSDPIPLITGVQGGAFSSTAGLVINSSTGIVNLTSTTVGSYIISYTTSGSCANVGNKSVHVYSPDNAGFSYPATSYCVSASDPTPTITGATGGTFSSGSGLSFNTGTGVIDVSLSTPNLYNVAYTTNGNCPTTNIVSVSVNGLDNANYDYGKTVFCEQDSDPLPTKYSPGSFSSTAGLIFNASSGLIDISASTLGTYSLTYTTTGTCPNTNVKSITISAMDNAAFSFPANIYCLSGVDPSATITGLSGGVFYSNPIGLAVNSSSGAVDLSASTPTSYSVIYTTNGSCPNSSSVAFTVSNLDNADYNYSKNNYCVTSPNPTPTISGLSGGTFTTSPAGLSINSSSGLINIGASTVNTYNITYTTNGSCPNTSVQSIILSNLDDAGFNYANSSYCAFSTDALPTITGLTSGAFSSAPAGLSMQQNNGYINTGSSNPGTYTITYTTAGDCMNSSSQSVTIITADDASFNYDGVEYCAADVDPSPTVVGLNGGNYSSDPAGLSLAASSGVIDLSVSLPEVYTVTYTTTGTCPNSSTQSIIVLETSDASFSYGAGNYCISGTDPTPTITGLTGGSFTSNPTGLSFNNNTGIIDLSASAIGTYNVIYSVGGDCPSSITQTVTIDNLENANFSYSSSNYCTAGADPLPVITGVPGGSFSSTPTGLLLYSSTGEVDVSASAIGNYSITYTTNGSCPNTSSKNFILSNFDDASFAYAQNTYCVTAVDPSPTITGQSGGNFSATPSGMSINLLSGKIDVSASTPGVYDVSYTTTGDCPNSNIQSITISALDNSSFNYASPNYCVTDSDPSPAFGGALGGTFSSLPVGLDLDVNTGVIILGNSTPSTYTVKYTTNGNCPTSSTQSVVVNALDNPGFNYGSGSFCSSSANPFPTLTGNFGGIFSSSPVGLTIDGSTGEIDISASSLNNYIITYTTQGNCPNSSDVNIVLNSFDDASFAYSANSFCTSNSNPTPVVTGVTGGSFSFSPSGLSFNASNGTINLANSLLGTYTITYATGGSCANSSSQIIDVVDIDNASFTYGGTHFCTNDADALVSISGVSGGSFASTPTGLIVDINSGLVDISLSSIGSYSISYTTNTSCPTTNSKTFNLSDISIVNQNVQGCDSVTLHGNKYFNSQVVIDTLAGIYCDSIVNSDLIVNSANTGVDVVGAWCSHIWMDGNEYFINNTTASHILVNQGGCDSIVTLNLTITSVDTSVNLYNSTFVSNASNATYQWVNCTQGYSLIPNATGKTFTPIQNGNYAVIVTENACTDTSACIFLTNVGIDNETPLLKVKVFPNPFNELINVEIDKVSDLNITITNLEGKLISSELFPSMTKVQISLSNVEDGVYFIKVESNDLQRIVKLIKQ